MERREENSKTKFLGLSRRAEQMPYSPIRKLAPLADDAKKRGVEVFHLNIGQPDIKTPKEFFDAIISYQEDVLRYGPSGGLLDLRLAVVKYYRELGIDIDLDNVWITTGGSEAIIFAMMAVCDAGDEIIVFEPFYTNYNGFAAMANVKLVPVTTNLSEEEMFIIYKLCKEHGLFLLSDEVYREFVYDGKSQVSALSLPEIEEQVILMDSISKRFSACGARVGCLVSRNKKIMDALLRFGQARLCPPTLEQIGAVAAYRHIEQYIKPIIKEYEERRNFLFERLREIPGVYGHKPEGAFYTVLRLPVSDADHFCQWLLTDFEYNKKTVMLAPANGFYSSPDKGKDEVRIAYVLNRDDLAQALEVLKKGLDAYRVK
ncbi:aspartate aminotransferase [candidate division WOR-3 bacterium 4484_100]|uniref:Aminotransferase n=1 Tax=candidate division WOR-3 bacterium 4484_100 TaxID=1936077 RepID=A0A1V4QF00_UNCW3|nr:MAG: aspartate aminotransferase [candidate division WOR-3 bacterium 4484_100]